VESAEALTSPRSRAGMPAAAGEEPREPQGAAPSPPRKRYNVAGQGSWKDQPSRRGPGLKSKEFQELPPPARLNLVRECGLCRLCLSLCELEGKCMHKRCRWKNQIRNELCQEQHKCRQTHHRLLHVDTEDERSLQTARPAKPAEPPNRLRRNSACSQAKVSRNVPAARKRRLTTSGMSAGASEVAATQKKSRKRDSGADDGRRAATPVAICGGLRVMPVTPAAQKTALLAETAETVAPSQSAGMYLQ
jgi:hypothetical protein